MLKTETSLTDWFFRENRLYETIDSLSVYRLRLIAKFSQWVNTSVIKKMFVEEERYREWKQNDSIVISQIFVRLLNKRKWVLLKDELNMYFWHQRNDLKKIEHVWLRIIMYFMIQQLVRQNLQYYCIMITLRCCPVQARSRIFEEMRNEDESIKAANVQGTEMAKESANHDVNSSSLKSC